MADNAADILRQWFQRVWIEGKTEYIDAMADENVRIQGLDDSTRTVLGRSGFREFYNQMHASFSDFQFTLDDVIGVGPAAAARWTMRLRHTGDGAGVPATGKTVSVTGMTFVHVADGRIIAGWNEWDRGTLFREIGAA